MDSSQVTSTLGTLRMYANEIAARVRTLPTGAVVHVHPEEYSALACFQTRHESEFGVGVLVLDPDRYWFVMPATH